MKSVRYVSFDIPGCCGSCMTILAFGKASVHTIVFVSGFAIFSASATTLLLVPIINSGVVSSVTNLDCCKNL